MHICCAYVIDSKIEFDGFLKKGYVPIGLSYISGALKQAGYTTEAVCFVNKLANIEKLLDSLEKEPDVFAVSLITVFSYSQTQELLEKIKQKFKNTKVIVGGTYVTLFPESVICNRNIDAVCIGEGEKAAVEYVRQVEKGKFEKTDNLWIKDADGKILKCDRSLFLEDINTVPMDRQIWDKWFKYDNITRYSVILQRGCPHRCLYCANHAISEKSEGKYLRYRDIDSIMKELEDIKIKFPSVDSIEFNADNAFSDMDYFFRLCEKLKIFNSANAKKFNFEIIVNSPTKFVAHEKNIAQYLKEVNITKVSFSLESGSLEIRKKLNRPYYTNEDIIAFCSMLNKEKIKTRIGTIYCYPFETAKTYMETIDCIRKCKPDSVHVTFLRSLPKTKLNEYMEHNEIPPATLKDGFRWIMMAVYLKINFSEIIAYVNDIRRDWFIYKNSQKILKYKRLAKLYLDNSDFKKAVKFLNKLVKIDTSSWIYGDLAIAKMNTGDYEGALKDFDNVLKSGIEAKGIYEQKREECLKILGNKKRK